MAVSHHDDDDDFDNGDDDDDDDDDDDNNNNNNNNNNVSYRHTLHTSFDQCSLSVLYWSVYRFSSEDAFSDRFSYPYQTVT